MRRYIFALLVFLTILVWIGVAIKYRIPEPIPGATDLELVGRCQLTFLDTCLQPFYTVVFGCPRLDPIRLWPFPIKYPWFEDWWELKPGEMKT